MRDILKTMRQRLLAGEELVLVTVIASSGATPRGAGARMLVGREGRICGTIGGGAVEYRSEIIAGEVLREKSSRDHSFTLTQDDVQNLGMICGGNCQVFFHYLAAGDPQAAALAAEAEEAFVKGKDLWLISDIGHGGRLSLAEKDDEGLAPYFSRHPQWINRDGMNLYVEQICDSGRVYVFGGGHVAQELVPMLAHVGFRCIVMDDRPEFASPALFPTAERVILGDFHRISDYLQIGGQDYVCVMTRGHASDTVVQAQVLRRRPCYCGVIGSKRKAAGVRLALKEEYGLTEEELDRVTTPIGLDILAETPEEIAVSITAQMIAHRAMRNRQGAAL
ncbi:MAG: XdhC family protein [Candidatus Ventricola sp.]